MRQIRDNRPEFGISWQHRMLLALNSFGLVIPMAGVSDHAFVAVLPRPRAGTIAGMAGGVEDTQHNVRALGAHQRLGADLFGPMGARPFGPGPKGVALCMGRAQRPGLLISIRQWGRAQS